MHVLSSPRKPERYLNVLRNGKDEAMLEVIEETFFGRLRLSY